MTAEYMVNAALAGLDQGEAVTWPSVADASLWEKYEAARSALFAGTQATSALARSSQRQADLLLAQICADNALYAAKRMRYRGEADRRSLRAR